MPFVPDTAPTTGRFVPDNVPTIPGADVETQPSDRDTLAIRTKIRKDREKMIAENAQPGTPLDLDGSLPAETRARVSFEPDLARQAKMLPGGRVTADGKNVIARVDGKDVLLHPLGGGLTVGSIAGETAPLLKMGAAAGAAALSGGASLPASAAFMGLGAAATEGGLTAGSRILAGQDVGDAAQRATKEGILNATAPVALAVGGSALKAGGRALIGSEDALSKAATTAAARQGLPVTPSMARNSEVLRGAEQAAGTPNFEEAQRKALGLAKDLQVEGTPPLQGPLKSGRTRGTLSDTEAELAGKAQPVFAKAEQAAAKGARTAMTDAEKAANDRIQAQLDSGLVPSGLTQSEGGKFIRGKVEAARDAFQTASQQNYSELHRLAAKEDLSIPTDAVTRLAESIKGKDPQGAIAQIVPEIQRIGSLERALTSPVKKAEPTGMFDSAGDPIISEEIPPKVTLPQAIELRAVVNDKIAKGDAVGDIPSRYLKDLAKALTEAIDAGVKTGSPELQAAFEKARGEYSGSIGKFTSADVGKLFVEPESGRALADNEIIPTLFRGKGNLDAVQRLKAVVDPKDYQLLLRQGAQSLVEDAKGAGDLIDAGKFLGRLNGLDPELRKELLGPMEKELLGNTRLLQAAQGGKFTEEELADAMSAAPGRAANLLTQAIERDRLYDQQYMNRTQKLLRDGVLEPRTMGNESDFVTRFTKAADPAEYRQALTQIAAKDPGAVEGIRQRTLQNILDEARVDKTATGVSENVDPKVLLKYARAKEGENFRTAIGAKGVQFLEDLATYMESNARRLSTEGSGSGLARTIGGGLGAAAGGAAGASVGGVGGGIAGASLGGAAGAALATTPKRILGKAIDASPAVSEFLASGTLPSLSTKAKGAILATPEAVKQGAKVFQDTRQERQ